MEKEDLEKIAEVVKKYDLFVLSDEIYSELTYTGNNHVTIASLPGMKERTILINGFSKSYAMTGWRLGYACGPEVIIKQMFISLQSCVHRPRASMRQLKRFGTGMRMLRRCVKNIMEDAVI